MPGHITRKTLLYLVMRVNRFKYRQIRIEKTFSFIRVQNNLNEILRYVVIVKCKYFNVNVSIVIFVFE